MRPSTALIRFRILQCPAPGGANSTGLSGVPAAIDGGAGDLGVTSNAAIPAGLTREAVLGFSVGAVMLVGVWVLIDRVRRRRRNRVLG